MRYRYSAVTQSGIEREGVIDSANEDAAITALQRRDLIVIQVLPLKEGGLFDRDISFLNSISVKEVVVLSRQIATLFDAQVSALQAFTMLAQDVENRLLARKLDEIAADIRGGMTISDALSKHPSVFSRFYINMVKAGEESGKLSDVFVYLADYLDRTYELTSKARGAMIYPAFVIMVFVGVMALMLTIVVPSLKDILLSSGIELPVYTTIIIHVSDFVVQYGIMMLVGFAVLSGLLYYVSKLGSLPLAQFKLSLPGIGNLYQKLYLSRISDNLYTMLTSGVPVVKALEVTADVVDNHNYEIVMREAAESVKTGRPLSEALSGFDEIPRIMVLMMRVGEETGELASILHVMADFYRREVENALASLISLIEPIMIVLLGIGVGTILAGVLLPMYSITDTIG
jgi:type IV pilus assembly protein PilC